MKRILQKLRTVATCFLNEEQVNTIEVYIAEKQWNALRIFISDLAEKYEVRLMFQEQGNEKLDEWLMIEEMNDIAIDIAIQMHEINEQEQPRSRKRIVRSS